MTLELDRRRLCDDEWPSRRQRRRVGPAGCRYNGELYLERFTGVHGAVFAAQCSQRSVHGAVFAAQCSTRRLSNISGTIEIGETGEGCC